MTPQEENPPRSPRNKDSRHIFYLVPTEPHVGLTSVSLGLVRALDREGYSVGFFKAIQQPTDKGEERSTQFLRATGEYNPPNPWKFSRAESLLNSGNEARLLQEIVEEFEPAIKDAQVVIAEGLQPTAEHPELETLNHLIVKALDAEVIFVSTLNCCDEGYVRFRERLEYVVNLYGGMSDPNVVGCIINKVNSPPNFPMIMGGSSSRLNEEEEYMKPLEPLANIITKSKMFNGDCDSFSLLGAIPWNPTITCPRMCDMARHLGAKVLVAGEIDQRRVTDVKIIARSVKNMIYTLKAGTVIGTPSDRDDIILAVCMAAMNGVPLSGLVLTGGEEPDPAVLKLCERAFQTGLPLLLVDYDSYVTAATAASIDSEVPIDDIERISNVMDYVAERLCISHCLGRRLKVDRKARMSPAAFMYRLVNQARANPRRIVLPEGHEPRIIKAAAICHQRSIAQCILLGDPAEVQRIAEAQGIDLPSDLEILQPDLELRKMYVGSMMQLRKHKGLTEPSALAQLEDETVLATMMVANEDAHGLVSGSVNSTANTVRPALQLIKTKPDANIISSIFFMCLPGQVLIYGDCAINPDPNAEELADIALQSAASAEAFGIEPRVAMISYSTGSSGKGSDVDKVREATKIAQERRPDLLIDGPLQYDAASSMDVAKTKAPDSKVAGRATVLVFPDLNTGNTTYKAVQRTANVVAIGPMLQGLRRPVNDLSRGASVDDIVYTIALTAIQAGQTEGIASPLKAAGGVATAAAVSHGNILGSAAGAAPADAEKRLVSFGIPKPTIGVPRVRSVPMSPHLGSTVTAKSPGHKVSLSHASYSSGLGFDFLPTCSCHGTPKAASSCHASIDRHFHYTDDHNGDNKDEEEEAKNILQ